MSGEETAFAATDRFDPVAMQAFMRREDVYWGTADALAPQPENVDFVAHLLHPDVWTVAALVGPHIIGYVLFNKRTSVMAEITVGFHPQARGKIAKTFVEHAIASAFREKGLLKILASIADDNKPARFLAGALGFVVEGRLRNAIVRRERTPPLADLVLYTLTRGDVP